MIIINQQEQVIFRNNNYIEYESSGDRNKSISVKEYVDKLNPNSIRKIHR